MPFFEGARARIYYRFWEADNPVAGVLFLHGGGEHSGQFSRLAARLNSVGIHVWAPDHQGHGISGGERGVVESLDDLVRDASSLVSIIRSDFPDLPLVIGGHSLGAATAALTVIADESPFVGAFLVGYAYGSAEVKKQAEETSPEGERVFEFTLDHLAADPSYLEELQKDPLVQLVLPDPVRLNEALARAGEAAEGGLGDVRIPVLLIGGTKDALTPIEQARRWKEVIPNAQLLEIAEGRHNVLNDVDYRETNAAVRDFVLGLTEAAA